MSTQAQGRHYWIAPSSDEVSNPVTKVASFAMFLRSHMPIIGPVKVATGGSEWLRPCGRYGVHRAKAISESQLLEAPSSRTDWGRP
jgi:hypothetical protein